MLVPRGKLRILATGSHWFVVPEVLVSLYNSKPMSGQFDVNAYWLERGRHYIEENRTPAEFHRLQEEFLLDVLRSSGLPMTRVLEIGCGFGRITRLLSEAWPEAQITALDLSPEQLANARRYCGDNSRVRFAQYDFYSNEPLPGNDFDCVLAIEVFLHHPPEIVRGLIRKLALAAGRSEERRVGKECRSRWS